MKTNLHWLRGAMAAGILLALPAGLRAEDEACPDRHEKYKQRYEENGKKNFDEADTNKDGVVSKQEAADYGVGRAENGKIGKKRFDMADEDGDGNLSLEEARRQREREEAEYRRRGQGGEEESMGKLVDDLIEGDPDLRERWQCMSPSKRAYLRQRLLRRFHENHPGIAGRLHCMSPDARHELMQRIRQRHEACREKCKHMTPEERKAFFEKGRCERQGRREELKKKIEGMTPEQREAFLREHPGCRDHREDVRDRREDVRDHREDVHDRREDVRDEKHDGGPRDRIEDRRDQREDVRDRHEDVHDRREDVRDREHGHKEHGPKPPKAPRK